MNFSKALPEMTKKRFVINRKLSDVTIETPAVTRCSLGALQTFKLSQTFHFLLQHISSYNKPRVSRIYRENARLTFLVNVVGHLKAFNNSETRVF